MISEYYLHTPLERPAQQIRVLQDITQTDNNCISCSLATYDIDQCPTFCALSYCWGADPPTHEIILEGKRFLVRDNLWTSLCELVRCDVYAEIGCIWIDAICINQQDELEKGPQISMMGKLYTRANSVIAWIGPTADGSDLVMQRLESLWYEGQKTSILPPDYDTVPQDKAITAFAAREYFYRTWTVQEFMLPQQLWIMCGSQILRWPYFEPIFEVNTLFRARRGFKQLGPVGGRQGLPLPFPLGQSRCRESKDRVYALIGLAKAYNNSLGDLVVDCSVSEKVLYFRVVRLVRDAAHDFKKLEHWYRHFSVFAWQLEMALNLPKTTSKVLLLMHRLIVASRRLDFCESIHLPEEEEDVWQTLLYIQRTLLGLIEKVFPKALQSLETRFDPEEMYNFLTPVLFDTYVATEDFTGWRAFEIALRNALLLWNGFSRTVPFLWSVMPQWQTIDSEDGEVCWQVGDATLLKSCLPR